MRSSITLSISTETIKRIKESNIKNLSKLVENLLNEYLSTKFINFDSKLEEIKKEEEIFKAKIIKFPNIQIAKQ